MKRDLKGKLSKMRTKTSKEAIVVVINYKYSCRERNLSHQLLYGLFNNLKSYVIS